MTLEKNLPTVIVEDENAIEALGILIGEDSLECLEKIIYEIGYKQKEQLIMEDYDLKEKTFNVRNLNGGKTEKLRLNFSTFERPGNSISILRNNEEIVYGWPFRENGKPIVELVEETVENEFNKNIYTRKYSKVYCSIELKNEDDKLSIFICKPTEEMKKDSSSDDLFTLRNEKDVKEYLLETEMPVDLAEVLGLILENKLESAPTPYSYIGLSRVEDNDEVEKIVVDEEGAITYSQADELDGNEYESKIFNRNTELKNIPIKQVNKAKRKLT